jgi:hypothetical protein
MTLCHVASLRLIAPTEHSLVSFAYSDVFARSNSRIITRLLTEQRGNSQEGGEGETQNT